MSTFSKSYVSLFQETHNQLAKSAGWFSPSEKEISAIAKLAPKYLPELKNMTDTAGHVLKNRSRLNRFTSAFTGHDPQKVMAQHLAHKAKQTEKASRGIAGPLLAGGGLTAAGIYGGEAISDQMKKQKAAQQAQQQDPYAGFTPQEIALLEQYYGGQYQ